MSKGPLQLVVAVVSRPLVSAGSRGLLQVVAPLAVAGRDLLQGLVTADAIRRTHTYAAQGDCQKVAFNPVGQVVGQINRVESCRDLVFRLLNEYVESLEKVNALMPETE